MRGSSGLLPQARTVCPSAAAALTKFKDVVGERLSTILYYDTPEDPCGVAFAGGPVALAYARFAAHTRQAAHAEHVAAIAPYHRGNGYVIPGEFVIACGYKR